MEIELMGTLEGIVIGATGTEEIVQNVKTILATARGTVPLDRAFGVERDFTDRPLPAAMARFTAAVVEEVEKQEPRVKVTGVRWPSPAENEAVEGRLTPVVRIRIRDGATDAEPA